jgi:tRNA (cmo5U34)-methyltransferase
LEDFPHYRQALTDYVEKNWKPVFKSFTAVLNEISSREKELPRCYMMLKGDNIIGFYQLVEQELILRKDLSPWITCVFIDEKERGQRLSSQLLEHGRMVAGKLGYTKVYLTTDHIQFYEKFGFREIGLDQFEWGRPTKIYEHATIKKRLEKMSDFFTARLDNYEDHMLCGDKGGYQKLAELVPIDTAKILDLGCGTGLELDGIFQRLPQVSVVGIDLTPAMLERLKQKHPGKNIRLICGNYFNIDLGENTFDTAISYQTMHHFPRDEKVGLYAKIRKALKPNGMYIEGDYMATEQSIEDKLSAENARLRRELNIPHDEYYHFDIPFTVDHQIAMFRQSGFSSAELVFRMENTAIIIAKK